LEHGDAKSVYEQHWNALNGVFERKLLDAAAVRNEQQKTGC
jgi:hypothetical protein